MRSWEQFPTQGLEEEIRDILLGYVKAESITGSAAEKDAEAYFLSFFRAQPYWREHPELTGEREAADDPLRRAAAFAMVRGKGPDTIVLIHHYDVVTVEDYKRLKPLAFSPEALERELLKMKDSFPDEICEDLESGAYLYGRGVCDMKGGAAIQMALLRRYGELARDDPEALAGNLIVLAVPDEENLSVGMRTAVLLLDELRERMGLRYRMMINSEPHQRKDPATGVFSTGSVGKLLPFFYVRGYLAHVGKMFEGFNPINLLSAIVRKTEGSPAFSDVVGAEAAPPPTWLFCRDQKLQYDVSMPLSAVGCLSVLTLNRTPGEVLGQLEALCGEAFDEVVEELNRNYAAFLRSTGREERRLPWRKRVESFSQLCREAEEAHGSAFRDGFRAEIQRLKRAAESGEASLVDCSFALTDYVFGFIDDLAPRVVYGLVPPYYPNVSNRFLDGLPETEKNIGAILEAFAAQSFGQRYVTEEFYTGISDLSYTSLSGSAEVLRTLRGAMPLLGSLYDLPAQEIERISMPCVNIGPWGKDFHKLTERVLKQDLYERMPRIIQYAIERILEDK